jgi:hypothetical protein
MDDLITPEESHVYAGLFMDLGRPPTDEELKAALVVLNWDNVRKERNELLAATDFYALSDVYMSDDMTIYREALRDLPESVENSEDVVWPEKPV